jgi:hypothetical protein
VDVFDFAKIEDGSDGHLVHRSPTTPFAMSKVVAIMPMSLDGYIADLNDGQSVQ